VENIYNTLWQNIFRTIITKFYEIWHGFVDDVTKTFDVFLGSQFQLLFTYETLGFTR